MEPERWEEVKENVSWSAGLALRWVYAASVGTAAALLLAARLHLALPDVSPGLPPHRFHAANAHRHLVNLTALGPRVAGSYENEVAAVQQVVAAVREAARTAHAHNTVELDLHRASGGFHLSFFDGMNNVYRDVQSVVARVRSAGLPAGRARRTALLLNCHLDTVPDSPGASDDGAGCAVLLETLRALASWPQPLRHDVIFLFNGAEENIMQASHAFITTHKWARWVRAFINLEACGAGGREVLFQAGPHDPWIMEVYARVVPHPFASSLAQELFESGLIPADTDFRIFRDFGNLSGVDLAWSANGYVYHTHLDTADRVSLATLQRTGDNVLALVHGLQASEELQRAAESDARQPVFFDVLGLAVLCARAPAAALAALAALALLAAQLAADARQAKKQLYVSRGAWWAALAGAWLRLLAAAGAGLAAGAAAGGLLHAAGARLVFYSHSWLLAPLYALPAVCVTWLVLARLMRGARVGAVPVRGLWAARLAGGALLAGWAALLLACLLARLRSGFLPLLWVLLPAAAARAHALSGAGETARGLWWAAGCALPVLQTWYLALGSLQMFVPIVGRAGTAPLPPDVLLALLVAALALAASSWMLPLVAAARGVRRPAAVAAAACLLLVLAAAAGLGPAPYSAACPQRYMVFHTRRTDHTHRPPRSTHHYWLPHLDVNTPHSLRHHVPELAAGEFSARECEQWPYCGAPYSLPVLGLVARGYWAPAPAAPDLSVAVAATAQPLNSTHTELTLNITGSASHVVVIVSPCEGARLSWSSLVPRPREGAAWGARRTYFFLLHAARRPHDWALRAHIEHAPGAAPPAWAALSVAGHDMAGRRAAAHEALLARMPAWTARTGWPVDLHLLTV